MNRRQIRTILSIAACVVIYTTLTSAAKHITAGNADRKAFARSLDNEAARILFDAIGPESRTLRITLGPIPEIPLGATVLGLLSWLNRVFFVTPTTITVSVKWNASRSRQTVKCKFFTTTSCRLRQHHRPPSHTPCRTNAPHRLRTQ